MPVGQQEIVADAERGAVLNRATTVTAEFDYEDDGVGGIRPATIVKADVASIVSDRAGDWAVIRAAGPLSPGWPVIALSEAATPAPGQAAFIVQHPDGERKRLGYVCNQIAEVNDQVIHYLTDTDTGSSGAPVFDDAGRLIAVHHAGGRPQEVFGRLPTVKNEGIRIEPITAGLTRAGITVG